MSLNITADSQYYAGTASPAFNASGLANFSFGIWVKRTNTALSEMYAEIGRAIGDEHDMVALGDGGTVSDGYVCAGGTQDRMNGMGSTNSTSWMLRIYTFEQGQFTQSYVGIQSGSPSWTATAGNTTMSLATVSAIDEIRIGGATTTLGSMSGWMCRAKLAHCFFYNKTLSSTEARELFDGGTAGAGKNPTAVAAANLKFYAPLTTDQTVHTGGVTLAATGTPAFDGADNPNVDSVGGGGSSSVPLKLQLLMGA